MVLSGGYVQFPIVNAHMQTYKSPNENPLIVFILYTVIPSFLGPTWTGLYPLTIEDGVDIADLKQF